MTALKDLTGQEFGRWTVVSRAPSNKHGNAMWLCICECGTARIVRGDHLRRGSIKSCGCLSAELTAERSRTHGHAARGKATRTYRSWKSAKQRCSDPNAHNWKYYGGLGISMCKRWAESYEAFIEDMGGRPPGTSLDRIDPHGDYEPGNCRWADRRTQRLNRRKK